MKILKAIWHALGRGLSNPLVHDALELSRTAAASFVTNDARRDYVISVLKARGFSESVARIAVELAVQTLKAQSSKA